MTLAQKVANDQKQYDKLDADRKRGMQLVNTTLSKDDAYMVRKYANRQELEIVKQVIEKNPKHRDLIIDFYNAEFEFQRFGEDLSREGISGDVVDEKIVLKGGFMRRLFA